MNEITGWILDLFPHPQDGIVLYVLDDAGGWLRLHRALPVTFYAAGPPRRLRALWRFLKDKAPGAALSRRERRDLFSGLRPVLAIEAPSPLEAESLFHTLQPRFPDLTWYDVDIPPALRFWVQTGAFPLARCRFCLGENHRLEGLEPLETPWEDAPAPAPLRILRMSSEESPSSQATRVVLLGYGTRTLRIALPRAGPAAGLAHLARWLRRLDPDILLTAGGDTDLLPLLLEMSRRWHVPLPLNRERGISPLHKQAVRYFSYGRVMYRGRQVLLYGRLHIDQDNAFLFRDYGLEGILETARVTGLPVQTAARVSSGSGISAMQIQTALRQGILVPWRKQEAERPRPAADIFLADQGGLVYQPTPGLHAHVAEIDFTSMYPALMVRFNLSPETVGPARPGARQVPELDLWVREEAQGLIPATLAPLLEKRARLKARAASAPPGFRRRRLQARVSAQKWLLVTSFGYLGYKNARFGRIEAHQAVTAYGREMLLRAKEAAEDLGFRVLHMLVDGLWVQAEPPASPEDVQGLLEEVRRRTGLPIVLEGIYRWVVFPPSPRYAGTAVPTRYFGVFLDGTLKARGIAARRRDTAPFIAETQMGLLRRLAAAPDVEALSQVFPDALTYLQAQVQQLRQGRVPLSDLVVTVKLHREASQYRVQSAAARAAVQWQDAGKPLRPGQRVRFLFTRGAPGVWAWGLDAPPHPAAVDTDYYLTLLDRAAKEVLSPLGVATERIEACFREGLVQASWV